MMIMKMIKMILMMMIMMMKIIIARISRFCMEVYLDNTYNMMTIMMMMMMIIDVAQSIFKLGPSDFAWNNG